MSSEFVRIELDLPAINRKKRKEEADVNDFADKYVIKFTRDDGKGISEDEAAALMMQYCITRKQQKDFTREARLKATAARREAKKQAKEGNKS